MTHSIKLKNGPQFYFPDDIQGNDASRQIYNYKTGRSVDKRVKIVYDDDDRNVTTMGSPGLRGSTTGTSGNPAAGDFKDPAEGNIYLAFDPLTGAANPNFYKRPSSISLNPAQERELGDALDRLNVGTVPNGIGYMPTRRNYDIGKKAFYEEAAGLLGSPGDDLKREADKIRAPQWRWEDADDLTQYYLTKGVLKLGKAYLGAKALKSVKGK